MLITLGLHNLVVAVNAAAFAAALSIVCLVWCLCRDVKIKQNLNFIQSADAFLNGCVAFTSSSPLWLILNNNNKKLYVEHLTLHKLFVFFVNIFKIIWKYFLKKKRVKFGSKQKKKQLKVIYNNILKQSLLQRIFEICL